MLYRHLIIGALIGLVALMIDSGLSYLRAPIDPPNAAGESVDAFHQQKNPSPQLIDLAVSPSPLSPNSQTPQRLKPAERLQSFESEEWMEDFQPTADTFSQTISNGLEANGSGTQPFSQIIGNLFNLTAFQTRLSSESELPSFADKRPSRPFIHVPDQLDIDDLAVVDLPRLDSPTIPFVSNKVETGIIQVAGSKNSSTHQALFSQESLSKDSANKDSTSDGLASHASFNQVDGQRIPPALFGTENYQLAAEPALGAHWKDETPNPDRRAVAIDPIKTDFSPDPINDCLPYDPYPDQAIFDQKGLYANQRPLIEWGRPWLQLGQLSPGYDIVGKHNPVEPQFVIYGDARTAFANNSEDGSVNTLTAFQANLNANLKVTSTERLVLFASPFTKGLESTGFNFTEDRGFSNLNANVLFGHFEGDLGAMVGGLINQTYPFELPFSVGIMPLLFQNGVWMEDAILGFAFTIPSRSSPLLDISNMDLTFFAGYDKLVSDAFPGDDSAAKIYGLAGFIEALNGYIELNYAFIEDRTIFNRSYHNLGMGFTRRYGRFISNSTRMILNVGQNPNGIQQTADGVLLLSENSLISGFPSTIVPYFNFFAGFDRPQSAARNGLAGGVLRNTGILFETDNLTGYPTLDPTANDTFGGAFGLNLLASDFSQQLVLETSFLNVMGNDPNRNAPGNQYGLGIRYQLPLTNALIFRADAMYGFLTGADDIHGARVELRHKF